MRRLLTFALLLIPLFLPAIASADWPTVGHDAQRTSYSAGEASFASSTNIVSWYREIPDYIPSRAQIITYDAGTYALIYVATEKGVYALDPNSGQTVWFYATPLPVGNSPTVNNQVLYIPSLDKTIHAVNAQTGAKIWQTDEAGAGFYTNPLVANNKVYAGNRDGYFYAFNVSDGRLSWHYPDVNTLPEGYIAQSAAISSDGSTIYYASSDSYAYALNAQTGSLIWRQGRYPGYGFYSYWPVYYSGLSTATTDDRVIFVRSDNFGFGNEAGKLVLYQANGATINGHQLLYNPPPPVNANGEIEGAEFIQWLTQDPDRQLTYALNPATGQELEKAPVLAWGNPTDNHYPPVLGPDNRLWFLSVWQQSYFGQGRYAGWLPNATTFKPLPGASSELESGDEQEAFAIFGGGIFHNDGGDGVDKGAIQRFSTGSQHLFWYAYTFRNRWPSYGFNWQNFRYGNGFRDGGTNAWNYLQGTHGVQNAPVPLKKRFFFHRSNNVISYCLDQNPNDGQCDP